MATKSWLFVLFATYHNYRSITTPYAILAKNVTYLYPSVWDPKFQDIFKPQIVEVREGGLSIMHLLSYKHANKSPSAVPLIVLVFNGIGSGNMCIWVIIHSGC